MATNNPRDTVLEFIEAINERSVERIVGLMTEDHVFTDSCGGQGKGRPHMREGWKEYFRMMPEYKIDIDKVVAEGNLVMAIGKASGVYSVDGKISEENRWSIPAAWYGVVSEGLVSEWRVFCDLKPLYRIIDRCEQEK
ncbi:MAG: nuclear transport factor 2 family protein [Candidatus Zixiibacteriota bacterium]|nr:MAG: nuclear transport factor 2 family protein [candidate division Zixibacteria bacterium]